MRNFTPEEKELIINTPVTIECFDLSKTCNFNYYNCGLAMQNIIYQLEHQRRICKEIFDDCEVTDYQKQDSFSNFVVMIPNSYKVVKLS